MKKDLSFLLEDEIFKLYELFFGAILIKKDSQTYLSNLKSVVNNQSYIDKVLERLNEMEKRILKLLSFQINIPGNQINEKLSLILQDQISIIGKHIQHLIDKNYIFIRDDGSLLVPPIYYDQDENYTVDLKFSDSLVAGYHSDLLKDIIHLVIFFISHPLTFSKNSTLYKKDFEMIYDIFSFYAKLEERDYHLAAYFFSTLFYQNENLDIAKLEDFFKFDNFDKIITIVKQVFPGIISMYDRVLEEKKSLVVEKHEFYNLWVRSFILQDIQGQLFKASFDEMVSFLERFGLIESDEHSYTIKFFDETENKDFGFRLGSNFCIYQSSDAIGADSFFTALFSEFKGYDSLVEYEITGESIRNAVINNISYDDVSTFLKDKTSKEENSELSTNVLQTIQQWFEKYGSYFFLDGTVFFSNFIEKGKVISTLIENGMVNAIEIKKHTVFFVPKEEKTKFFNFLKKSDIEFCDKTPISIE